MAAADLANAVQRIGKPPCEKGCEHINRCSREEIACGWFLNYVSGYKSKNVLLATPSVGVFKTIYNSRKEAA